MSSKHWVARLALAAAFAVSGLGAIACDDSGDGTCASDSDCPPGARCDVERAVCVCQTDEACDDGEFCNGAGVCQLERGCTANVDCQDSQFCDLDSGRCLDGRALEISGLCGLPSHCPSGSICRSGVCQPGCITSGDCELGEVCIDGQCDDSPGRCADDSFCEFGASCVDGFCEEDFRGPYCRFCTPSTQQNPNPCDDPRNFCLVNNQELGGFTNFCGVDCSLDQSCPNGYECNDVLIRPPGDACVTDAQCQCEDENILSPRPTCQIASECEVLDDDGQPDPDAQVCVVEGEPECNGGVAGGPALCVVRVGETDGECLCATDEQCPEGSACVGGDCCTGELRSGRQCLVGEGRLEGFCTCERDRDCPADNCNASTGACSIQGLSCTPEANDCPPIPCVDGLCFIGQNCAPEAGLACSVIGN